jgi:hypothetical protein
MPSARRTLSWNTQGDTDLAGWKVYAGTASGVISFWMDVGLTTSTGAPTATLTGLLNGKTYYVALTAYDQSLNESTFGAQQQTGIVTIPLTNVRRTYA